MDEVDDASDADSSSSEELAVWTAEDEKNFLRSLSAVHSRDPKIYSASTKFFDNSEKPIEGASTSKKGKAKKDEAMYLRDYEQKLAFERGGQLSNDDDEISDGGGTLPASNIDDQSSLKQEFKKALASDDDSDSDLLQPRIKTEEQKKQEENDYYEWLKGEGSLSVADPHLRKLKDRWSSKDLDTDERFLRDYLYEKKYENDDQEEQEGNPTYEQIIQEEEEEARAELFEHKYNFRFEEPDQEFLKSFPRTVQESLRQQSGSKRSEKRLAKKEKRAKEKETQKLKEEDEELEDRKDGEPKFKFRYRTVPANDFGLTTEEILSAEDSQLNAWAPVQRVSQYRSNEEEDRDIVYFQRKAKNVEKKKKIFKAALEKTDNKNATTSKESHSTEPLGVAVTEKKLKSKKNKRKATVELDADRLRSYGVGTKKLKRLLYNKKQDQKLLEGGS